MRLRYAPHLVGSKLLGGPATDDAARDALNIILNENFSSKRPRRQNRRRSKSRDSAIDNRTRVHRILSADAYRGKKKSANGLDRKWSN